jgi:hypothetical protein
MPTEILEKILDYALGEAVTIRPAWAGGVGDPSHRIDLEWCSCDCNYKGMCRKPKECQWAKGLCLVSKAFSAVARRVICKKLRVRPRGTSMRGRLKGLYGMADAARAHIKDVLRRENPYVIIEGVERISASQRAQAWSRIR